MSYTIKRKKEIDERIAEMFDKWVPFEGSARCQAGEFIRALEKIRHGYYNNGERIFQREWHNKSIDIAADYLWSKANQEIKNLIDLATRKYGNNYEKFLYQLAEAIIDFIDKEPSLEKQAAADMFN